MLASLSSIKTSLDSILHHRLALTLSIVCGVSVALGYILESLGATPFVPHTLFLIAYLSGGWLAAKETWEHLREGQVDVHLLMLLVAAGAWMIDAHEEGAILLFLFSLSGALESFAEYRTHKAVTALYKNYPKEARKLIDGKWVITPIDQLGIGDELQIRPGDLFPTDGIVIDGSSFADESALTGEAMPVPKKVLDSVSGGTLNLEGQLIIRTRQAPSESAVQKIIRLVDEARRAKAPAQRMTDLVGRYYTWFVLVFSTAAYFYFRHSEQLATRDAFYATMVLLVVASPCALVLSIPSSILTTIASGARRGILFQGGRAVEELARINVFALDKTGTITYGRFIVRVMEAAGTDSATLLRAAAAVESASSHPLAHGVLRHAAELGISIPTVRDVKNYPGEGIEASVDGEMVRVGKRSFAEALYSAIPTPEHLAGDGEVCVSTRTFGGTILLRDELRSGAKDAVALLEADDNRVLLLSGDRDANVAQLAKEVGITDFAGDLTPEDKLRRVEGLKKQGYVVAMTGDGINDAPSLAAAHVSIVMGDRGSDAALEEADIVLMGGGIMQLPRAVDLSKRARRIIGQNLFISLGTVAVLVIAALGRDISLPLGVVGHEGSTVVVVLNSLRLLRTRGA